MNRIRSTLGCAVLVAGPSGALAQTWPAIPAKVMISTGPGLSADRVGRLPGDPLGKSSGQPRMFQELGIQPQ